jgi:hypothetical protein
LRQTADAFFYALRRFFTPQTRTSTPSSQVVMYVTRFYLSGLKM